MRKVRILYTRKPSPYSQKAHDAHALLIGDVSIAWNGLHEKFYSLFAWVVRGDGNLELPYRIWHSLQSDSAQRGMLRATVATTKNKRLIRAVDWLVKQAEKIGKERNALVHTPIVGEFGDDMKLKIIPSRLGGRENHLQEFAKKPKAADWQRVRGNLRVLAQYASMVEINQFYPTLGAAPPPWPYRPRLIGLAGSTKPKRRQLKRKTTKRKRPPESSQASP